MSTAAKLGWLLTAIVVVISIFALQFVPIRLASGKALSYTSNAGELTRDVLVGQTFQSDRPNLSGVSVLFATYSNRPNTAPVVFHLRESIEARQSLRTAEVVPSALADNQFHRFVFEPIPDSQGKTYFFFVVSPAGATGNAVTVDLDTRDPYHQGSAYLVRGQGSAVTDPTVLARSGKPTVDVGFALHHTVPLRAALVETVRRDVQEFIATWDEQRDNYLIWLRVAIPASIFFVWLVVVRRLTTIDMVTPQNRKLLLALLAFLILAAVTFRFMYAIELPVTNDEGNYLYDARTAREGKLAGGDGYVKAPLVIAWIALWQAWLGDTVIAGRLSSIVAGALLVIPIYWGTSALLHRRAGLIAAAAWALWGAPTVFSIYVHTQPVAVFFGVTGIAILLQALTPLRSNISLFTSQTGVDTRRLIMAGMLLGLGVASRKSILALGLVPLLLILCHPSPWSAKFRHLLRVGIGFGLVVALFLGAAYWFYGEAGVSEAIGLNSAEDGISTTDPTELANARAYSLRGMTPFFRESLPLIVFSLLGWGSVLEMLLRNVIRRGLRRRPSRSARWLWEYVVPKLGWLPPLVTFAWCWRFFFEYEGQLFMFLSMRVLWLGMAVLLALAALWPRPRSERYVFPEEDKELPHSTQPSARRYVNVVAGALGGRQATATTSLANPLVAAAVLLPAWLGGLAFFYTQWIKFHANYIAEFLPPLVMLSGLGLYVIWQRWLKAEGPAGQLSRLARGGLTTLVGLILAWSLVLSGHITYVFEHTGTFDQRSAREAAAWARENIPLDQPLFTGAALVPYISGHHAALDIAHPRWYAYEFTRKNTSRLEAFLPPIEDMLNAYRQATWILHEQQTGFSFLMEYSEIEAGLAKDFELVHEVDNLSNPLKFYRRKP